MRAFIAVLLTWLGFAGSALAENRLALVIGNDSYQHIDALLKARADARSYADLLREKGFSVEDRYDLGIVDMQAAVGEFVEKIEPGDTAVFVYSGHGWSDGAHNYLLGVDVPNRASQDLLTQLSLPIRNGATGMFDIFERKGAGLKVAIIDACRDNPFQPPPGRKSYVLSRGLRPEAIEGSFVVYSAGEGQSAMDRLPGEDADPNSLFTRVFLPLLHTDLPLLDAIKLSQERVYALARSADHDQTPAYYDEVRGRACLSRACKGADAALPPPDPSAFGRTWSFLKTSTDAGALKAFLDSLPADSPLRGEVEARIEAIPNVPPMPPKPTPLPPSADEIAWNELKTSFDRAALKNFVATYPSSRFRPLAEARLASLSPPPKQPPPPPSADEIAWNALKTSFDRAALKNFVANYPSSRFRPLAAARLASLPTPPKPPPPAPPKPHKCSSFVFNGERFCN